MIGWPQAVAASGAELRRQQNDSWSDRVGVADKTDQGRPALPGGEGPAGREAGGEGPLGLVRDPSNFVPPVIENGFRFMA